MILRFTVFAIAASAAYGTFVIRGTGVGIEPHNESATQIDRAARAVAQAPAVGDVIVI